MAISPAKTKYCQGCGYQAQQGMLKCPTCGATSFAAQPPVARAAATATATPARTAAAAKYCAACGRQSPATLLKCPACGKTAFVATPPVLTAPPPSPPPPPVIAPRWYRSRPLQALAAGAAVAIVVGIVAIMPPKPVPPPEPPPVVGNAEDCKEGKPPARVVAGCTVLVQRALPAAEMAQALLLRGYAHMALRNSAKALADWDEAFKRKPNAHVLAARVRLYTRLTRFDDAAQQLDQAASLIARQRATEPRTAEREREVQGWQADIKDAGDRLALVRTTEPLWIAYLKDLEAAGPDAYRNWSGPPYQLYLKNRETR